MTERRGTMDVVLPVLAVLLAIVIVWYGAAIRLNMPWAEEQMARAQQRAQQRIERLEKQGRPVDDKLRAVAEGTASSPADRVRPPKIRGGSTISQQLAKNLLLSSERTLLRKGQELLLTQYLELFLDKRRILEIYLNNVEFGSGIFGAEAAAQHYYGKPASKLSALEAARLAVMLPRPRYFQQHWQSGYLSQRAQVIARRMAGTAIP